jgi:acetyl-CoA acetyltransferase
VTLRGATAIVGIGQTEFSKASGRSELQLAAEATLSALADAGLRPADIDGMITFTVDPTEDVDLMRTLGIDRLSFSCRIPHGGGGSAATVLAAASAIATGAAEVVLIYRALNARSGRRFGAARDPGRSATPGTGWGATKWMAPFGALSPAAVIAMGTTAYMSASGATNEDFGRYIVGVRDFACTNPAAWFYRQPVTLEQHQESRWIMEPVLRLLDCCQESDGGVAVLLTSTPRARDLRQPPAVVLGAVQGVGNASPDASRRLFAQAGLAHSDIQAAMIYDAFSPNVFMGLEQLGFCAPGEAKELVADGHIRRGGRMPVNTNGGLIGEAYIHGMNLVTEAVRQVRGSAVNQVANVEHVVMASGSSAHILGRLT